MALDALVKGCSDILVVSSDGSKLYLGRRKVEPQPDWWFIGGRARPGDETRVAAARNVKRELGLDLAPSRFEVLANYSFVWRMRAQPPCEVRGMRAAARASSRVRTSTPPSCTWLYAHLRIRDGSRCCRRSAEPTPRV